MVGEIPNLHINYEQNEKYANGSLIGYSGAVHDDDLKNDIKILNKSYNEVTTDDTEAILKEFEDLSA